MTNSHYTELQSQKQEKMEDAQVQGQINNKESTLVDIMSSLCNITNSIKGIEERLGKLEITSDKEDELETRQIDSKNDAGKLNQLKTLYEASLANKKKISENHSREQKNAKRKELTQHKKINKLLEILKKVKKQIYPRCTVVHTKKSYHAHNGIKWTHCKHIMHKKMF